LPKRQVLHTGKPIPVDEVTYSMAVPNRDDVPPTRIPSGKHLGVCGGPEALPATAPCRGRTEVEQDPWEQLGIKKPAAALEERTLDLGTCTETQTPALGKHTHTEYISNRVYGQSVMCLSQRPTQGLCVTQYPGTHVHVTTYHALCFLHVLDSATCQTLPYLDPHARY
jgi:hypothetical protein